MNNHSRLNAQERKKNIPDIMAFCEDLGLEYRWIAGDWHLRIENVFDVFPTRKRYHFIPTDERGGFADYEELGRIFTELAGERS